jgi:hypothetical protein
MILLIMTVLGNHEPLGLDFTEAFIPRVLASKNISFLVFPAKPSFASYHTIVDVIIKVMQVMGGTIGVYLLLSWDDSIANSTFDDSLEVVSRVKHKRAGVLFCFTN